MNHRATNTACQTQAEQGLSKTTMKRTPRLIITIVYSLSILGIAGCATPYSRLNDYKASDSGNLVLSLGVPFKQNLPALRGKMPGTGDLFELTHMSDWGKIAEMDMSFTDGVGRVIARKLPPGEYEINHVELSIEGGFIETSNPLPIPVRFSIQPGQTTYIGRYLVEMTLVAPEKTTQTGAVTTIPISAMRALPGVTNEQERDIASARTKYPGLNIGMVKNSVPARMD